MKGVIKINEMYQSKICSSSGSDRQLQKTIPIGSVKKIYIIRVEKYHFGHFLCPLAAWLFAIFTLFFLCLTLLYVPLLKSFDVHLAVSTCLEYVENIFSHSLKKSLASETDTINSGTILQNFNFAKLHKYQMALVSVFFWGNEINYFPHILGLATCPTFWQTLLGLWNPSQSVHFPKAITLIFRYFLSKFLAFPLKFIF